VFLLLLLDLSLARVGCSWHHSSPHLTSTRRNSPQPHRNPTTHPPSSKRTRKPKPAPSASDRSTDTPNAAAAADEAATWRADYGRVDIKHGAFSEDEKATLSKAVADYAALHGHGASDYAWLLQRERAGRLAAGEKGPVSTVAAALPSRTRKAVLSALKRMYGEGHRKVGGGVAGDRVGLVWWGLRDRSFGDPCC